MSGNLQLQLAANLRTFGGASLFGLALVLFGVNIVSVIAAYFLRGVAIALIEYLYADEFSYIYHAAAMRKYTNG